MCDLHLEPTILEAKLLEQAGSSSAEEYFSFLTKRGPSRSVSYSMEEDAEEAGAYTLELYGRDEAYEEDNPVEEDDVFAQLAQKEKDLVLAAELGKALLVRNQEMTYKFEQQAEEYNHKIEELTQGRHELSLKLDIASAEYEATVRELQADIVALRSRLDSQSEQVRQGQHSHSNLVTQLTAQNERLNEQLRKATEHEGVLERQVQALRELVSSRKQAAHEHVQQFELLRQELSVDNLRNSELERRVGVLVGERNSLSASLDEAQDRILVLERHTHEHQLQVTELDCKLEELREQNNGLQDRVEMLSNQTSSDHGNSLLHELEMSHSDESAEDPDLSLSTGHKSLLPMGDRLSTYSVSEQGSVCEEDQLTRMQSQLACRDLQLQRQHTEMHNLSHQVQSQVDDLAVLRADRDRLQDGILGMTPDDVLKQTREERDQAFAKLGQSEIELAEARRDVVTLNGQLMEAIQQKVYLSQQLDQWEVDMHELLGAQMAKQIKQEEKSVSAPHSPATQRKRRFPPWNS